MTATRRRAATYPLAAMRPLKARFHLARRDARAHEGRASCDAMSWRFGAEAQREVREAARRWRNVRSDGA